MLKDTIVAAHRRPYIGTQRYRIGALLFLVLPQSPSDAQWCRCLTPSRLGGGKPPRVITNRSKNNDPLGVPLDVNSQCKCTRPLPISPNSNLKCAYVSAEIIMPCQIIFQMC